ncbi:MAG TPA: hypothetical protein VIK01_26770 [Polyangiaceae bacterium]
MTGNTEAPSALSAWAIAAPMPFDAPAGLVRSERVGVEMQNTSRCAEIETRFPGLLPAIIGALQAQSGEGVAARPSKKTKTRSR